MPRNSQDFAKPVYAGLATHELQVVLNTYFSSHSADETIGSLSDLLQSWISPDAVSEHNKMNVANMVFFATNLNTFILKVAGLDFNGALGINENSETRLSILYFFDSFGYDFPTEIIMEALQEWICPDEYSTRSLKKVADAVSLFSEMGKMISKLEVLNTNFKLEGGLSC